MTYNPATHDVHIMAKTLKEVSILVQRRERGRESDKVCGRRPASAAESCQNGWLLTI